MLGCLYSPDLYFFRNPNSLYPKCNTPKIGEPQKLGTPYYANTKVEVWNHANDIAVDCPNIIKMPQYENASVLFSNETLARGQDTVKK